MGERIGLGSRIGVSKEAPQEEPAQRPIEILQTIGVTRIGEAKIGGEIDANLNTREFEKSSENGSQNLDEAGHESTESLADVLDFPVVEVSGEAESNQNKENVSKLKTELLGVYSTLLMSDAGRGSESTIPALLEKAKQIFTDGNKDDSTEHLNNLVTVKQLLDKIRGDLVSKRVDVRDELKKHPRDIRLVTLESQLGDMVNSLKELISSPDQTQKAA